MAGLLQQELDKEREMSTQKVFAEFGLELF